MNIIITVGYGPHLYTNPQIILQSVDSLYPRIRSSRIFPNKNHPAIGVPPWPWKSVDIPIVTGEDVHLGAARPGGELQRWNVNGETMGVEMMFRDFSLQDMMGLILYLYLYIHTYTAVYVLYIYILYIL